LYPTCQIFVEQIRIDETLDWIKSKRTLPIEKSELDSSSFFLSLDKHPWQCIVAGRKFLRTGIILCTFYIVNYIRNKQMTIKVNEATNTRYYVDSRNGVHMSIANCIEAENGYRN